MGQNIQLIRKRNGLSQQALADKLGEYSRSQIAAYEAGTNQPPHQFVKQFVRMCNSSYEEVYDGLLSIKMDTEPGGEPARDLLQYIQGLQLDQAEKNVLLQEVGQLYKKLGDQKDKIVQLLVKGLKL